ncbi:MAG: Probable lipoprotein Cj1090c [uncultured Sulfurovum sp.]|uniref:Probable lipoprotein Cj1090c n=1 Tax=uncultured Sulfurovum sp. TaxID=269237 RepID=A0A6S6SYA8_9BACT|nr:MAG: Probable lipoprotein Cj1090c [uncultured Sulfurovum sp.]
MKKHYFLFLLLILLTGCGYKPSAHYAKQLIGEKVYVYADISLADPENAVLTKDALNLALRTRFGADIVSEEEADSSIKMAYKKVKFVPLQYDRNGYVVYYQVNMTLNFIFKKDDIVINRDIIGRYEFPISSSAIISSDLNFQAIKHSSKKALDEFISYLGAKGYLLYGK